MSDTWSLANAVRKVEFELLQILIEDVLMREAMEAAKTTTKKATTKKARMARLIKRNQVVWLLALFLIATAAAQQSPLPPPQKRVSPDAYDRAPVAIRAALKKQQCELPEIQHWDETQLNIVQGHFGDSTQNDWAAICIAPDGSMRTLIFWGKSAPCPAEIRHGWSLKGHFPPGQAGSLYLLKAPPSQITAYREFFGDSHTNPILHDGVEIGGDEASLIYYCHKGRWLDLAGND